MKSMVAHYCLDYLDLTQTFVYNFLKNIKRYDVAVVTRGIINQNLFFLEKVYCLDKPPKYSVRWFMAVLSKIVLGKDIKFEKFCIEIIKNANLIHAHFGPRGWEVLNVKRKLKIPLITTFYGYDLSQLPQMPVWKKRYRQLFEQGDLFLVEGNHMKKKLAELGCPISKIKVVHIGVELSKYPFRTRMRKNHTEKTVFLFCGRFLEKKGLLYALQALLIVSRSFSNVEFRIIGDGDRRGVIEKFIRDHGMGEYVKLMGLLSHHDVIKEMDKADIFLHPSVTATSGDTEGGAPTILIEAQAMGMPVLSTYHCDIPEVVVDGRSGLLCPERDSASLADNIMKMMSGKSDWGKMGAFGRSHVELNYNIDNEIAKLEDIYSQLAD